MLFDSIHPQQEKDYALLLSFAGQARLQFAGLHSLFLALWCIVIEIAGGIRIFTFLVSDVSISSIYSPLQMLFWQLMYLQYLDIHFRRCSFGNWCICNTLIFASADALFLDQSICNLLFFELADTFQPACHVQLHLHLAFL